jgi:cobalt-zinc-cadmium efflux system membrane fusion protein
MRHAALSLRSILLVLVACQRTPAGDRADLAGDASITTPRSEEAGVTSVPAVEREIGAVVSAGRVARDDEHVVRVFSPLDGRLVAVSVQVGQHVKKGDPLASIDAPEIRRALGETQKARAELVAAEHDYQRQEQLHELGEPQRDMEAAYDQMRAARAELERAQAKARRLGPEAAKGNPYVLRAPIDGKVLARNVDAGAVYAPKGAGSAPVPLFILGDER